VPERVEGRIRDLIPGQNRAFLPALLLASNQKTNRKRSDRGRPKRGRLPPGTSAHGEAPAADPKRERTQ
jgi:hypothetical protein